MSWIGNLEGLSDDVLERCRHPGVEDGFDWNGLVNKLRVIRDIARDLDATPVEQLSDGARTQAQQILEQLLTVVGQIEAFDYAKDANAHNTRNSLESNVTTYHNQMRDLRIHARPRLPDADELNEIRAVLPELRSTTAEVRSASDHVADLTTRAEGIIQRLTEAAAQSASGTLSKHYTEQAGKHEKRARDWLIASGAAGVIVVGVGLLLFLTIDVKGVRGVEFARDAAARLVALSILSYALSLCTRGYRAQTHLAIVCRQKANALDTFGLFQETAATAEGKEAVTVELVRTVFAISDSGYLDGGADKTIVEQQGGALTTLLAARRS